VGGAARQEAEPVIITHGGVLMTCPKPGADDEGSRRPRQLGSAGFAKGAAPPPLARPRAAGGGKGPWPTRAERSTATGNAR